MNPTLWQRSPVKDADILTMHPAISTTYIVPAIFLNPVLFLMSLNTILSRILPPIDINDAKQPPPHSTLGPSAEHPHLDVHASENLCWGYTAFIVCAQLAAYGRVGFRREEGREQARTKAERCQQKRTRKVNGDGTHANGLARLGIKASTREERQIDSSRLEIHHWQSEESYDESHGTSDSEIIL